MKLRDKKALIAPGSAAAFGRLPLAVALGVMDPHYRAAYISALGSPLMRMGDVGNYDTATLIEVLYAPAQAPELAQFWLQFFGQTVTFDTQEIRFDAEDINEYRLAPFVAPNVQGRVLRSKGFNVKSLRPAYVKPKHVVDPARAIPRRAGERPLGTLSLQERFDAIVADNLRRERAVIENRWEWMACKAIVDAAVTISGEDYPTRTVDFQRDPSLTYTLVGGAKWDQTTANVMSDIQSARQNTFRQSNFPVNRLIFGLDAWNAFTLSTHADVQRLLDGLRRGSSTDFNAAGTQVGGPYEYQGSIGGIAGGGKLDLFTYHYTYEDSTGARVDYLDQGTVVGIGSQVQGLRLFGAIMDVQARLVATELFPKQWDENDPSVSYTMTQSAPLMAPIRPNNTFKMKVVGN